jgi:putative SOS response-associated peptidase YedK
MCGRVIQSSGPLYYAIVEGLDVRDSRLTNYPRRWNGAPSQEFLVIRENHKTGERSLDLLRWGRSQTGAAIRRVAVSLLTPNLKPSPAYRHFGTRTAAADAFCPSMASTNGWQPSTASSPMRLR